GALVSWEVDGLEVSQGVVTSPEEEKEGLYRRSSTLTLSKAGWEQGELYTCRVSHFQHTQASPLPGPTVSPTVSLLPPSSEQLSGGSASLACLLTGYSPQGALVSWEVDGLEVSQGVVTSPEEEKEGLYRRSSTLTLSKAGWEQGELYTCRVSHFQHTQASPLRRMGVVPPSLTVLLPSSEEQDQGNVALVCLAHRGFPGGWNLGWRLGARGALQGSQSLEVLEKDGHYSWSSSLTLPTDQWRKSGSVTCEASLKDQTPITHTLEPHHSGPTVSPTVFLLPPSSEQLSGGSASLACLLTGYSPQGALVSWEVDGLEVSQGVVTSPEQEKEGLYRRSSTLTLSKAGWEQGELYTCRVSHFQHTQASPLRRSQCLG
uniref:Ig-like domain-containing protein n=1 Tax=Salmo trutta TaxID=8032 RepID=A0A674DSS1_SALTR